MDFGKGMQEYMSTLAVTKKLDLSKMDPAQVAEQVAKDLLQIEAVFLRPEDPFTWASGIKSPLYCDNRLILTATEVRARVEAALAAAIAREFPTCQVLMGTATAGIAHAAIAASILGLPMGYVRGKAKDHGRTNRIEGRLRPGEEVVIVEDLISTAGSAIETAAALKEAGAKVLGIVSLFTYGMEKGLRNLKEADLTNISLCNLDILTEVAVREQYITESQKLQVLRFRDNPDDPSWQTCHA